MKSLILIAVTLISSSVFACTDFSGNYKDQDGNITKITQIGCESIQFSSQGDSPSYVMITDGKMRQLLKFEIGSSSLIVNAKAAFENSILKITTSGTNESDGNTETSFAELIISLDTNGDLVNSQTSDDGTTDISVLNRI